jgi:hypothetical protein
VRSGHARTGNNVALLMVGIACFLVYALDRGAEGGGGRGLVVAPAWSVYDDDPGSNTEGDQRPMHAELR